MLLPVEGGREGDPLRDRELTPARRIGDLRPHEDAGDDEAQMLEVVNRAVRERVVVEVRDVPTADCEAPEHESHAWPNELPEKFAQRAQPRQRREHRRGEEEEEQRPAQRNECKRRRGVPDRDVLQHVCG